MFQKIACRSRDAGESGAIKLFTGCQHIDMYSDPLAPWMWRVDGKLAPTGIVGDTGNHVFSFMEFLVGRVSLLIADNFIVMAKRPVVQGLANGAQPELTGHEEWSALSHASDKTAFRTPLSPSWPATGWTFL